MVKQSRIRSDFEQALLRAIEGGLPLVARPYAEIADRLGVDEASVIETIESLAREGEIKRMGVIVRHRELGYRANAMVVWDVPDEVVARVGRIFGAYPAVTLCYRRPRRSPWWNYNLFTMIHARRRDQVMDRVRELAAAVPGESVPHEILFSGRRFKQRGARYGGGTASTGPAERGDRRASLREVE